ncbi:MAG: TRAP transporter substrate-binding protein DctP [Xanthobacteraceae bacterium]
MYRFLAAALALVASTGIAPAQELPPGPPVAITIVTQFARTSSQYTRVDGPLLGEDLPRRSGGRISVTLFAGFELYSRLSDHLEGLGRGQHQLGSFILSAMGYSAPLFDLAGIPGLVTSYEMSRKVGAAVIEEFNGELARSNLRILAAFPLAPQVLFCREPVGSLASLKGRRVRAIGPMQELIQAIGALAIVVPIPEAYYALERGILDCAVADLTLGNMVRWHEVTRHLYMLPVHWGVAVYAVNLAWWNKLDPAVRDFLQTVVNEAQEKQRTLGLEVIADSIACNTGDSDACKLGHLADKNPMTLTRPTEADREALRSVLTGTVLPAWVKRCGDKCGETYNRVVAPITGVRYEPR